MIGRRHTPSNRANSAISKFSLVACIVLNIFLSLPTHAQSQPPTITTELSRSSLYVGDSLKFQVFVRGISDPHRPNIDFPESLGVTFDGRSNQAITSMYMNNGKRETFTDDLIVFQYTLTAKNDGFIDIPAATVTHQGTIVTGEPVSFEVILPQRSNTDRLDFFIEDGPYYQNQTISAQCVWWISGQTSDYTFASSYIPENVLVQPLAPPSGGQQQVPVTLKGNRIKGIVVEDTLDGTPMTKLVFRVSLTPQQAGEFSLGPMRVMFTRRDGTGRNFRAYVQSDEMSFHVKPTPQDGRPSLYSGAIGEYSLITKASNHQVNVGDPIELILTIIGEEPMIGIASAPSLSQTPGFSPGFKVASEGWRETKPRRAGVRIFTTTLRALNDEITEIPSIVLHSFSPISEQYITNASEPIPIQVRAVEELTLKDAFISGGTQSRVTEQQEQAILVASDPTLWSHPSIEFMVADQSLLIQDQIKSPVVISLISSGPMFFGCMFLLGRVRDYKVSTKAKLIKAYKQSKSLLRNGQESKAFSNYVGAFQGINIDSITGSDVLSLPISSNESAMIKSFIDQKELSMFSPPVLLDNSQPSSINAKELLRSIHTQLISTVRPES